MQTPEHSRCSCGGEIKVDRTYEDHSVAARCVVCLKRFSIRTPSVEDRRRFETAKGQEMADHAQFMAGVAQKRADELSAAAPREQQK